MIWCCSSEHSLQRAQRHTDVRSLEVAGLVILLADYVCHWATNSCRNVTLSTHKFLYWQVGLFVDNWLGLVHLHGWLVLAMGTEQKLTPIYIKSSVIYSRFIQYSLLNVESLLPCLTWSWLTNWYPLSGWVLFPFTVSWVNFLNVCHQDTFDCCWNFPEPQFMLTVSQEPWFNLYWCLYICPFVQNSMVLYLRPSRKMVSLTFI